MKNILVVTILVLGVFFTGCNNTDTSVKAKGSFSKQEIKTLLKDGTQLWEILISLWISMKIMKIIHMKKNKMNH